MCVGERERRRRERQHYWFICWKSEFWVQKIRHKSFSLKPELIKGNSFNLCYFSHYLLFLTQIKFPFPKKWPLNSLSPRWSIILKCSLWSIFIRKKKNRNFWNFRNLYAAEEHTVWRSLVYVHCVPCFSKIWCDCRQYFLQISPSLFLTWKKSKMPNKRMKDTCIFAFFCFGHPLIFGLLSPFPALWFWPS